MNHADDAADAAEKIRTICARLREVQPNSLDAAFYFAELQNLTQRLMAEQKAWNRASEPDVPQDQARQSYSSRETDSADGFADGLKLFNRTKSDDSDKKRD
jgi:hypothetical protein